MGRIAVLSPMIANQIAAGEVVERPASVIKELMENSLDAQSRHIRVQVWEGGRQRMLVQDDGQGMEEDDLALSVARHATSKVRTLADLESGSTLGFRGEALAAISSVSRLVIRSRTALASHGFEMAVVGTTSSIAPVAMGVGTVVDVSQIFENVPGRLKALKTAGSELGAIEQVVRHYAIGYPSVAFDLASETKHIVQTAGRGDFTEPILNIFGADVHKNLMSVSLETSDLVRIKGFILPAHYSRANRHGQGIYINGRWITNWTLRNAIEEAFRPNIPDRRYPWFWFWLDVNPHEVDPNVHPTKMEVRLTHERRIAALLYRAVSDALASRSLAPHLAEVDGGVSVEQMAFSSGPGTVPTGEIGEPVGTLHREFLELTPLAQWQSKYIIAQGPLGLYLIDQHAAHERIYYEKFRRLGTTVSQSQPLLIPWTKTLSATEWAIWQAHQHVFTEMGFDISETGGTTLIIRAIPRAFDDAVDIRTFQTILDSLVEGNVLGHPTIWAENQRFAMAACKAAVKAYRPMSFAEMESLLQQMASAEDPRGCPHGRPTLIRLSIEEVDRRFGRHGF